VRVLPEALQPFAAYKQFITWKLVQKPDKPKPDKVPFSTLTGKPHDPHDPAIWLEADTAIAMAAAAGLGVGFVFTAQDPFFFFDLDACAQPNGTWSQLALDMCARFTGCAMEVSQSGQGLHIFGDRLCSLRARLPTVAGL
jgi:primase-polymerase (primpol)-like protein